MKKSTIKDVANLAKVSIGTASKVINKQGNVKLEYQSRVWEAVKKLEYHPNIMARGLKLSSSKVIALLLADLTNPFQMTLAKGVESVTYNHNYQILISSTKEDPKIEQKYLRLLYGQRVDGIILCSTGKVNNEIKSIINKKVPIVLVDRPILTFPIDIVADNSLIGMDLLVEHLYKLGHKRIGIIHGDRNTIHGRLRAEGFFKAMKIRGLNIIDELQYEGSFSYDSGTIATEKFMKLSTPPTAIISSNNNITAGVLDKCNKLNIHIPNDLSIVSYGNLEYNWDLIKPLVTYVSQSPLEIGKQATNLLFKQLETSQEEVSHNFISPNIVVRESTQKRKE